jgi:signal peptidase I
LISDFTAYNTGRDLPRAPPDCSSLGVHWVGDLALQCVLDVQSADGEAVFELVKGGRQFQCRIDVASGRATLGISGPGAADFHPAAATAVRGPGSHKIIFSNVDDELRLWVDGNVAAFDAPTAYDRLAVDTRMPKEEDLSPAGIAARGAAVKASHIKLLRDLYYIADKESRRSFLTDFVSVIPNLAEPGTWSEGFSEGNMNWVEFVLAPPSDQHPGTDQFFVMGDNSAQSKDGRLWEREGIEYWVSRDLLIGKAFYIYWPHSWETFPFTNIHIPFYDLVFGVPNFRRMHLVR